MAASKQNNNNNKIRKHQENSHLQEALQSLFHNLPPGL